MVWNEITRKMGKKDAIKARRKGLLDTMEDGKGNTLYLVQRFQSQ
jgi:hypothetical protein